jgi:hypothetical protein
MKKMGSSLRDGPVAGNTTTRSPIVRPRRVARFSYTVSVPHLAPASAATPGKVHGVSSSRGDCAVATDERNVAIPTVMLALRDIVAPWMVPNPTGSPYWLAVLLANVARG